METWRRPHARILAVVLTFLLLCTSEHIDIDYLIEVEPVDIGSCSFLDTIEYDSITDQISVTITVAAFSIAVVMDHLEENEEFVGAPTQSAPAGNYTGNANFDTQEFFVRVVFSNSTLVLSVSGPSDLDCSNLRFRYEVTHLTFSHNISSQMSSNSNLATTLKPSPTPTWIRGEPSSTPTWIREEPPTPTPTWIRGEPSPTPTWIRGEPSSTPTWIREEPPTPTPTWIRGEPSLVPTSEAPPTSSPSLAKPAEVIVAGINQETSWVAIAGNSRFSTIFFVFVLVIVAPGICVYLAYRRWYRKRFDYSQLSRYDAEYYERRGAGWTGSDGDTYHSKRDVELSQYLGDEPKSEFPVLTL